MHETYTYTLCGKILNRKRNKVVKQRLRQGYYVVGLCINGKRKFCYAHRVVLSLHTGVPYNTPLVVNHINGVKDDNRVENLEWCTQSENSKHAYRIGLSSISPACRLRVQATHGKRVINTATGIIYPSMRVAAFSNNMPEGTLRKKLLGHRPNNTNFIMYAYSNTKQSTYVHGR